MWVSAIVNGLLHGFPLNTLVRLEWMNTLLQFYALVKKVLYKSNQILYEVGAQSYKYTGRSNALFCFCADINKDHLQPLTIQQD